MKARKSALKDDFNKLFAKSNIAARENDAVFCRKHVRQHKANIAGLENQLAHETLDEKKANQMEDLDKIIMEQRSGAFELADKDEATKQLIL